MWSQEEVVWVDPHVSLEMSTMGENTVKGKLNASIVKIY